MARGNLGRRLILKLGRKSRRVFNRAMVGSSQVGDPAVFPASVFGWTATLEANLRVIQRELEAVMAEAESLPGVEEISPSCGRSSDRSCRWWKSAIARPGRSRADRRRALIAPSFVNIMPDREEETPSSE